MIKENKIIIRWTIGNVPKQGLSCLKKSIKSFINCYGINFDFYICYNNIPKPKINLNINIKFIKQENTILEGSGSIWKYTPARIDISKKELFIDNDIVFIRKNEKIINFFNNDSFLICQDNIQYYGRFQNLFKENEKFNAGLIGFPSKFDLENNVIKTWKEQGQLRNINSADEQGLVSFLIKNQSNYLFLKDKDFIIVNGYGDNNNIFENKWLNHDVYHFVELNRKKHRYYNKTSIAIL